MIYSCDKGPKKSSKMPKKAKTHYEHRISICFLCCRKSDRILTSGQIDYIKTNILPNFDNHKEFVPLGTCGSCRRCVSEGKSTNFSPDYDAIIKELSELPRGINDRRDCTCFICEYGRSTVSDKLKPGRPKAEFSAETSRDNRSLPESRVDEIDRLMKNLTPRTKSGLGHALIKEQQETKSTESPVKFTSAAGGAALPVYPGAKRKLEYTEKNPISNQVFKQIQNEEDLSNKTVRRIQSVVRKSLGPGSVESHLREELIDDPKVKAELIVEFSGNF